MIEQLCKENLEHINKLIQQLKQEEYTKSLDILSGSSVGQHVRHITEFYTCLMKGMYQRVVNYDQRERDLRLETDTRFAIYTIDKIMKNLPNGSDDFSMELYGNFTLTEGESLRIPTSFFRELAYCLEHSIHHQALIKIGLIELNQVDLIHEDFGIAPATIRYKSVQN